MQIIGGGGGGLGVMAPLAHPMSRPLKTCKLLVLPSENIWKNYHVESIKFKSEVKFKNAVLTASAKSNAPAKFTSPDRIKLTLQQKKFPI